MVIETDIGDLKPHMKPGWVAMDANGRWCWFKHKPVCFETKGLWLRTEIEHPWVDLSCCLAIERVTDWKQSLTKIGGKNDK